MTLKQEFQMLSGTRRAEGKTVPVEGRVRGEEVSIKAGGRLRCKSLRKKQRRGEVHSDGTLEASRRERLDVIRLEFAGIVDEEGQRSERR